MKRRKVTTVLLGSNREIIRIDSSGESTNFDVDEKRIKINDLIKCKPISDEAKAKNLALLKINRVVLDSVRQKDPNPSPPNPPLANSDHQDKENTSTKPTPVVEESKPIKKTISNEPDIKTLKLNCTEDDCVLQFTNQEQFEQHLEECHQIFYKYRCLTRGCKASFKSEEEFQSHLSIRHKKNRIWKCPKCFHYFSLHRFLLNHYWLHHERGEFSCGYPSSTRCKFTGSTRQSVQVHYGTTRHRYYCSFCIRTYFKESTLEEHEKQHTCRQNELSKQTLYRVVKNSPKKHLTTLIEEIPIHEVQLFEYPEDRPMESCEKIVESRIQKPNVFQKQVTKISDSGASSNKSNQDEEEFEFIKTLNLRCLQKYCFNEFTTKLALNSHMKQIHGLLPFPCHQAGCGESFASQTLLDIHSRSHNATKWKCRFCGREFAQHHFLTSHIALMHEFGQFVCSYENCGFSSSIRQPVHIHFLTKHEFMYSLSKCSKKFAYEGGECENDLTLPEQVIDHNWTQHDHDYANVRELDLLTLPEQLEMDQNEEIQIN